MVVYRISKCTFIKDLSGKGAAMYPGRWNSKDTYVVYTAESRSLALLEVVAHLGQMKASGFCMIEIDMPDNSIETIPAKNLPPDWTISPSPDYLKEIGDRFIRNNKYLALRIPCALMPEEYNYLINPVHPLFSKVKITMERALNIDGRLIEA